MAKVRLACPAAAIVHPVLSRNANDIECGVAGHLRPADDSPCCQAQGPGSYVECGLWRLARDLEQAGKRQQLGLVKQPKRHVLTGVSRDAVRV